MKSPAHKLKPAAALHEVLERDVRAASAKLQVRSRLDVHAVRKDIKHARAIVRLLLNELSHASYQRINLGLRDAARPLAQTRDTEVLLATIARLERKHRVTTLRTLHDALVREQRQSRRKGATPRQAALAKRRLATLDRALAKIRIDTTADWTGIIGAVAETYRRARKAAREARSDATSENLHEWRKQVKYLWHQMKVLVKVLVPLARDPLQRLARDLHRLADHLGDDHDLALLQSRIEKGKEIVGDELEDLQALLARRRARLERKAYDLGGRLFDDRPKQFERKLERRANKDRLLTN